MNALAAAQLAASEQALRDYSLQCHKERINQYTNIVGMDFITLSATQSNDQSMDQTDNQSMDPSINQTIPCVVVATQTGGVYLFDASQHGEKPNQSNNQSNNQTIIRPIASYELVESRQNLILPHLQTNIQSSNQHIIITGGETLNIFTITQSDNQSIKLSLLEQINLPSPVTHIQSVNQSSFVSVHEAGQLLLWSRSDQSINQSKYQSELLTRFKLGVHLTGLVADRPITQSNNQTINQTTDLVFVSDSRGSIHAISLVHRWLKRDILTINQSIDHLAFDAGMSAIIYVTRSVKSNQTSKQSSGSTIVAHHWPTLVQIASIDHNQSINQLQWPHMFDSSPAVYSVKLSSNRLTIQSSVAVDRSINQWIGLSDDGDTFCLAGEGARADLFRSRAVKSATLICQ